MPFENRLAPEILQEMTGQVVSQTDLTDLSEGSVLLTLLGAVAEQLEAIEFRLKRIRDSFDLDNVSGLDLDERVSELPGNGLQRIKATPASGAVLKVTRGTTTGILVLPKGATFGRTDAPDIIYATTTDTTFDIGVASVSNIRVTCLRYGPDGNADKGAINKLINVPSDIIAVQQMERISGGLLKETDDELRNRAKAYLGSLAQSQPDALKAAALSFVDSSGQRVRYAHVFEDAEQPAYSELVVDDGTGFAGFVQPGLTVTGTVPVQGTIQLNHQAPATDYIKTITINGTDVTYDDPATNPSWISIPERGIVQLKEGQTDLAPGDTWSISGYNVYTGFISELQPIIEGSSSNPTVYYGKRAAGTRVRVLPPIQYPVAVTANLILQDGVVVSEAIDATTNVISEFFLRLGPGDTMYISDLYQTLENSLSKYIKAVNLITPTEDFSPSTMKYSLRAYPIKVT